MSKNDLVPIQTNADNNRITISVSETGKGKVYTYGFREMQISIEDLGTIMNRFSVSGSIYKDGHRKSENIIRGSNIILIDCDEPGQAEAVESKIKHYDYVKAPSASNSEEKPYKWHYAIPVQKSLSIYPAAFRWQIEEFFRQVDITNDMIDTTGSYDIARQFAPASIGMSIEAADELLDINNGDFQVPVSDPPKELCSPAAKSLSLKIEGKQTDTLPSEHLWFQGNAITYNEAIQAVKEAYESREKQEDQINVSGFGCPHNNHKHEGDVSRGYGFAFIGKMDIVIVKCTGNCCKDNSYFMIPEPLTEVKADKLTEAKVTPVHPSDFKEMVKNRVHQLQPRFKFGENMMSGFFYYGATYNECFYRNKNELSPMRFAVPAPTGSAKSVSAKLYLFIIAMMGYSGLLVVGKVKNAIDAVQEINDMAGKKIAACIFSVSNEHPDCNERVDLDDLQNYPIAVITHNMFLHRSNSMDNIDLLKNYSGKQRESVIIDEHIDFKRTVSFTTEELRESIGLVKNISGWDNIEKVFETILESEHIQGISTAKHPQISRIMKDGIKRLRAGDGYVGMKKDRRDEEREAKDRDWMIRLMDRVAYIFDNKSNMIIKQGKYTSYSDNEDLTNKFGSVVILDATADASPIYRAHLMNRDDINQIEMPVGIRNYQNATLHVCHDKQRRQSKAQLVAVAKEKKTLKSIVDSYLSALYPLVSDGSKLLVVTFKDIEEVFRSRCQDDNIVFIHWGIHEGTNAYSHFSKVAAIGWFRKSKRKYHEDLDAVLDDANDYCAVTSSRDSDVNMMITGGLAADFVQGFNRSRSRVAIDEEGNCAPVDFYMFDDGSHDSPISIITKEMPGINMVDWEPAEAYPITKSTISDQRAERIVKWLQQQASGAMINAKSVIRHFDGTNSKVTEKNFKDVTHSKLFKMLLDDADIIMRITRGRYGGTFFDIPEGFEKKLETDMEDDKAINNLLFN